MSLKEKIYQDKVTAMKSRDTKKVSALNGVLEQISQEEHGSKSVEMNDDKVQSIVQSIIKRYKSSIEEYDKVGGSNVSAAEKSASLREEVKILSAYVPEEMSDGEIREIVTNVVSTMDNVSNPGLVMKQVMPHIGKRADGKKVMSVVREVISQ